MWFAIDFSSPIPVYKQIKDRIKALIRKGQLREGQFVPSIRSLGKSLGVNLNTVARAYRELAAEGVLEVQRGEGYVVSGKGVETFKKEAFEILRQELVRLKEMGFTMEEIIEVVQEVLGGEKSDAQGGQS